MMSAVGNAHPACLKARRRARTLQRVTLPLHPQANIYYKRSRFTTWLPPGHRFTPSHFWLSQEEPGLWRVGFTRFATRMLGDFVEIVFSVNPGDTVSVGQSVGSVEGFKAVSEIYSVASGEFAGGNAELANDPGLIDSHPYDQGWLYRVRGSPDPNSLDVFGYIQVLDATIDRMRAKYETPGDASGGASDEDVDKP